MLFFIFFKCNIVSVNYFVFYWPTSTVFLIIICFSSSSINAKKKFWGVPHFLHMCVIFKFYKWYQIAQSVSYNHAIFEGNTNQHCYIIVPIVRSSHITQNGRSHLPFTDLSSVSTFVIEVSKGLCSAWKILVLNIYIFLRNTEIYSVNPSIQSEFGKKCGLKKK